MVISFKIQQLWIRDKEGIDNGQTFAQPIKIKEFQQIQTKNNIKAEADVLYFKNSISHNVFDKSFF